MSTKITAEHLTIANLAVQLLPKIELPEKWQTMHPHTLARQVSEPTTGKGRDFSDNYVYPEGWATPWEIVAEEAVKRAKVLLDAAAGKKRQARQAHEEAGKEAGAAINAWQAKEEEWRVTKFDKHISGRSSMPLREALTLILPKTTEQMRWLYWREHLRESQTSLQKKHELPGKRIVFADEATRAGDEEVISDMADKEVDREWFGRLGTHYKGFYDQMGEQVRKQRAAQAGKKGGKKTARLKDKQTKAVEARYARQGKSSRHGRP